MTRYTMRVDPKFKARVRRIKANLERDGFHLSEAKITRALVPLISVEDIAEGINMIMGLKRRRR